MPLLPEPVNSPDLVLRRRAHAGVGNPTSLSPADDQITNAQFRYRQMSHLVMGSHNQNQITEGDDCGTKDLRGRRGDPKRHAVRKEWSVIIREMMHNQPLKGEMPDDLRVKMDPHLVVPHGWSFTVMQMASTLLLRFKRVTKAPRDFLNVEIGLQNVSLNIPFLVLSTEMTISGDVEKHILTPFGYVDIVFPNISDQAVASFPSEIQVVGDIDTWMLDEVMPSEFRVSILGLIGEIANSHFGCLPLDAPWTSVRFRSGSRDISVMWERCPRKEVA